MVKPPDASLLASGCCSDAAHAIQGGAYRREKLSLMAGVKIDGHLACTDEDATTAERLLALQEGLMAGYAIGAQRRVDANSSALVEKELFVHEPTFAPLLAGDAAGIASGCSCGKHLSRIGNTTRKITEKSCDQ